MVIRSYMSSHSAASRGTAAAVVVIAHVTLIVLLLVWRPHVGVPNDTPGMMLMLLDKPARPPFAFEPSSIVQRYPRIEPVPAPEFVVDLPDPQILPQTVRAGSAPEAAPQSRSTEDQGASAEASGEVVPSGGTEVTLQIDHRVQPVYPDESVRRHEQGYVVAAMQIDPRGRVHKVRVLRSSGYFRLDEALAEALRQWTFTRPPHESSPAPLWVSIRYGFQLAPSAALDLSGISLTVLQFDPALAAQIIDAAMPAGVVPPPNSEQELRRLIEVLRRQSFGQTRPGAGAGAVRPAAILAGLGAVQSVQFLGLERHGLEVDDAGMSTLGSPAPSRWEHYRVSQERGESEWLIAVNKSGKITIAQAMECVGSCS